MKHIVKVGATSRREYIFIQNSSVSTGAGLTGLVFNSAGLTAYYVRPGGSATSITLATQTVTGAFSSGGFVEVDATNMPGVYRFDIPDAVFASGVNKAVVLLKGATNMAPVALEYQLVAFDPDDAVRAGLTALPNAAAEAAGGLYTRGTGAGQINQPANGQIDTNVHRWLTDTPNALQSGRVDSHTGAMAAGVVTAAAVATDAIDADALAADAIAEINATVDTALADYDGPTHAELVSEINDVQTDVAAVQSTANAVEADTQDIQSRLPAALVSGRMDSDVRAIGGATTVDGVSLIGWARVLLSALAGKVSGMGTNAPVFRDAADSKDRITATTDDDGNRTAVTLDGT